MVKFHNYTLSQAWTTDYGCSDSKYHFGLSYQKMPSPLLYKISHHWPNVGFFSVGVKERSAAHPRCTGREAGPERIHNLPKTAKQSLE